MTTSADPTAMPSSLAALVARAGKTGKGLPPVDKWNPPFCGDLDIRIDRDGRWFYLGSPIGREPLVRLFASVLRKDEDGRHFLVTPVEKIGITVEDVPFIAVELDQQGEGPDQVLTVRTNVGDVVTIDAEHPLEFRADPSNDGLLPYLTVRGRLMARFSRPLLYQLAELFEGDEAGDEDDLGVYSSGTFFPVPV